MKIDIKNVVVLEGPLYAYRDGVFNDEGETIRDPGFTTYDYFVVATAADGQARTHVVSFDHLEWHRPQDEAQALADRVIARGSIESHYWAPGSPWSAYSEPETWEEERARELEWEAGLSATDNMTLALGGSV